MDRLPPSATPYPELVAAWASAVEGFAATAESLTAEQWYAASVLPGWTNGDIVAHVVGIEQDLLGEPLPTIDIDWDTKPHARDLFSRYTEIAVEARRGEEPGEVCAELRKAICTACTAGDRAPRPGTGGARPWRLGAAPRRGRADALLRHLGARAGSAHGHR